MWKITAYIGNNPGAQWFGLLDIDPTISGNSYSFVLIIRVRYPHQKTSFMSIRHFIIAILLTFLSCPLALRAQAVKTYTVLVGLSRIDNRAYQANHGKTYSQSATSGVPLDIYRMEKIATINEHHHVSILMDEKATRAAILDTIKGIGSVIKPNEAFLFYFSGHGDITLDLSGDEITGQDQLLAAYDNFIIDDEIYALMRQYFRRTENVMIIDACHSSTSYKNLFLDFGKVAKGNAGHKNEKAVRAQA